MANECLNCGFYDSDLGCSCSPIEKWYSCPIENEKPENRKQLEDYVRWCGTQKKANGCRTVNNPYDC